MLPTGFCHYASHGVLNYHDSHRVINYASCGVLSYASNEVLNYTSHVLWCDSSPVYQDWESLDQNDPPDCKPPIRIIESCVHLHMHVRALRGDNLSMRHQNLLQPMTLPCSQGAKWVYLTWDAVKGLLVSFCSVASTYQILTAQPENYVAGKKL